MLLYSTLPWWCPVGSCLCLRRGRRNTGTPALLVCRRRGCCHYRGDWQKLAGARRNSEELGGARRNYEELVGARRNWEVVGRTVRHWEVLGGSVICWELVGRTVRC